MAAVTPGITERSNSRERRRLHQHHPESSFPAHRPAKNTGYRAHRIRH
jgi:hypothetical protein